LSPDLSAPHEIVPLLRLLPLEFPRTNLLEFVNPNSLSLRFVAVDELGLFRHGCLSEDIPLHLSLWCGGQEVLMALEQVNMVPISSKSGKGSIKVTAHLNAIEKWLQQNQWNLDSQAVPFYLNISIEHLDHEGVGIGPFYLTRPQDDTVVEVYRTIQNQDSTGKDFIQEEWGLGIPGKVWDSALVLKKFFESGSWISLFNLCGVRQPNCILDLSSGNALIAMALADIFPDSTIYCSDVSESFNLLKLNSQSKSNIIPALLYWGQSLAQAIQNIDTKVDLLLCSDLLYEAEYFQDLYFTMQHSIKPMGLLFFAYKPRGLTESEQDEFFNLLHLSFTLLTVVKTGLKFGVFIFVFQRKGPE
jgi:hypothetical protein